MLTRSPAAPLRAVTGIHLTLLAEGGWVAACCTLRRRGSTVTAYSIASGLTSLADLRAALPEGPVPVALVLTGRGVLYRQVPNAGSVTGSLAAKLALALPGAAPADFYAQQQPIAHGDGGQDEQLSLVRRELVDTLLTEFRQAQIWVVDLSLGPVRFAALLPYLPQYGGESIIAAGGFRLTVNALAAITDFTVLPPDEPAAPSLQIGADLIVAAAVLPYGAALTCLLAPADTLTAQLDAGAVHEGRREWWHFQLFQVLRLALPCLLFVILLANFLLSQQLQADRENLTVDLGQSQLLLTRLKRLQQTVTQKQAFLAATGWSQPSWNSLCADRLAVTIPAQVHLLSLEISPSDANRQSSASGSDSRAVFRTGTVLVKGQCPNAQSLNGWLQKVAALSWVRSVRDQDFIFDYASGVGTFTFALEINPSRLLQ